MASEQENDPSSEPRKRRKVIKKESIYLKSEPTPYAAAIKPLRARSRSARPTGTPTRAEGDENGAESSEMAAERGVKSEKRRLGALKAWETKRRKQKERFEALESGFANTREAGDIDSLDPFLPHLFVPDNTPKDDLLDAIHAYASCHYTANSLLLPPKPIYRRPPKPTEGETGLNTQVPVESDEDDGLPPGSEYQASEPDGEGHAPRSTKDEQTVEVRRKRGGQRGKRKLKDMYLALDGSALLAVGTLIQDLVVAGLEQEGYIPAGSPERDGRGGTFQLSDSDNDDA